jgi:hypothetical protein
MRWNKEMASEQDNFSESTSSIFLPTLHFYSGEPLKSSKRQVFHEQFAASGYALSDDAARLRFHHSVDSARAPWFSSAIE